MSNTTLPYKVGDVIPFHFSAPIVVASCLVSLLGCITTVELLHRKKGNRGWSRWFMQLGIAVSFGLVGIWCMHFVGNRAIILGNGESELQLDYSPGFTALSAFLPIIFLFFALTLFELKQPSDKSFWPILITVGFIAGLSITGMHYVGNFGISNYKCGGPAGYIVGAAAVAIIATIVALSLFFYFKEKWVNSFPKRLASAVLLAGAVSGMHWLASIGTTYTLKNALYHNGDSRNVNLIVALVCAILACVVCLAFAFLTQRRRKELADRAQHVVLSTATFDYQGRLLVTQEGLPPSRKVTKQFNQKSFDDEFNVAHPVFQWLYRVTYNWTSVTDLIPRMRNHLRAVGFLKDRQSRASRPSTRQSLSTWDDGGEVENDYSVLFREYFCVAASELAGMLDTSLEDLGVLYNGILTTGSSTEYTSRKKTQTDLEKNMVSPAIFGNGQLLFLVRSVDKTEASRLVSQGFRFAYPKNVSEIIARTMRVPHADMIDIIERLHIYSQPRRPLAPGGTYLACFAIRALFKSTQRSWEILVPTDRPGDLPTVEISESPLTSRQLAALNKLDGLSVSQSITFLNNIASEINDIEEQYWIEHLLDKITELTHQVPENFFKQAVFSCKPVLAPGLAEDRSENSKAPQLYSFSVIPDVHGASIKSTAVTYVPLSFFQCIQRVYKGSPDHAILAQRIHREFGTILSHKELTHQRPTQASSPRMSTVKRFTIGSPSTPFRFGSKGHISLSSKRDSKNSMSATAETRENTTSDGSIDDAGDKLSGSSITISNHQRTASEIPVPAFGGIMVSSDTKVEVFDKDDNEIEMQDGEAWGTSANAKAVAKNEAPTYVDELFKMTSLRFQRR